jgi:translocation protein SEC72
MIEEDFSQVPLALSAERNTAVCAKHSLEKCSLCDLDFVSVNRLSNALLQHPTLLCPPPGNVITPKITQLVTSTKEEGNVCLVFSTCAHLHIGFLWQNLFKVANYPAAITRYTAAAAVAISRPPWESNQLMCEELSTVISNRSAAYFESRDYISALADAETVIEVRKKWSKGHFRKAKALLGLGRTKEAADSVKLGLSFEPTNAVRQSPPVSVTRLLCSC